MKRDTQAQERDTHLQGVDFADVRSLNHENGGPDRIRTYDLPLRRRSLYPLSYGATGGLHARIFPAMQPGNVMRRNRPLARVADCS